MIFSWNQGEWLCWFTGKMPLVKKWAKFHKIVDLLNFLNLVTSKPNVCFQMLIDVYWSPKLAVKILNWKVEKEKFWKYQCICMGGELSTAILLTVSCPSGELSEGQLLCSHINQWETHRNCFCIKVWNGYWKTHSKLS